ncbi:MAG: polysaccharide biosynthesis protein [Magnetococcales bacterium]|nr:polysaccharide biosynthesis protein [Magnetococcales bacterium]
MRIHIPISPRLISRIHQLPRRQKQLIILMVDLVMILACQWLSNLITSPTPTLKISPDIFRESIIFILISFPVFIYSGMYRAVVQHTGDHFFFTIFKSIGLSILLTLLITVTLSDGKILPVFWVVFFFLLLMTIGGSRLLAKYLLYSSNIRNTRIPVAIYGAGAAGIQLSQALKQSTEFTPIIFLDDDVNIQNTVIHGLRVHSPQRIKELSEHFPIQRVLLAIPSVSRHRRREILKFLERLPIHVQEIPSLVELASGAKQVDDVQEVCVEDLLGREPIAPKQSLLEACITDKVVLVTGAGGSIGSELCRQIIQLHPRRLVLVEHSEYFLYCIEGELRRLLEKKNATSAIELVPILGSVLHRLRMQSVITTFGVQTIYHAAAYKHVPIIEYNPIEGIQNNIFGTWHMAQAAIDGGAETFILVSTDKAVRPTNVMGATKRFSELILQAYAKSQSGVCFSMVRFGNVLASSGSVIPLFYKQIKKGGPVTVTDPSVTRFFMTIPEATQLVIQAGAMARCGDVFILDMGSPVNILDMAKRMIQLSGFTVRDETNPDGDIPIQFTGLRPGEKLYEELLIGDETQPTEHPMIMRAREEYLPWPVVKEYLDQLAICSKEFNYTELRNIMLSAVKGYQPSSEICDLLWTANAKVPKAGTTQSA